MSEWIKRASAILFAPAIVAGVLPFNIVLHNRDDMDWTWAGVGFFAALCFALTAVSTWAHTRAGKNAGAARTVRSLAGFTFLVLAWDGFAAMGAGLALPRWGWLLGELLLAGVVVWALRRAAVDSLIRVTGAITPVVLAVTLVQGHQGMAARRTFATAPGALDPSIAGQRAHPAGRHRAARAGNVYHIILDQYQSQAFQFALERQPGLKAYPFTFYPEFRANAWATAMSNAILFAGETYAGGTSIARWVRDAHIGGMLAKVADAGVTLHQYPFYVYYCHPAAKTCVTALEVARPVISSTAMLIDLWFLRLTPRSTTGNPAQRDTWDYGFSLTDLFTGDSPARAMREFGRFSMEQFRGLIADEARRPATGQYVFAHLLLPHGPMIFDEHCRKAALVAGEQSIPDDRVGELYLEQVLCTNNLMIELFDTLRRLGRFEDSLIVVHSDHGRYFSAEPAGPLRPYLPVGTDRPFELDSVASDRWDSEAIELRSAALLWIKLPGQAEFRVSPRMAQTIDIAPTILRHFGIPVQQLAGIPIQTIDGSAEREPVFTAYSRSRDVRLGVGVGLDMPTRVALYRKHGNTWVLSDRLNE